MHVNNLYQHLQKSEIALSSRASLHFIRSLGQPTSQLIGEIFQTVCIVTTTQASTLLLNLQRLTSCIEYPKLESVRPNPTSLRWWKVGALVEWTSTWSLGWPLAGCNTVTWLMYTDIEAHVSSSRHHRRHIQDLLYTLPQEVYPGLFFLFSAQSLGTEVIMSISFFKCIQIYEIDFIEHWSRFGATHFKQSRWPLDKQLPCRSQQMNVSVKCLPKRTNQDFVESLLKTI